MEQRTGVEVRAQWERNGEENSFQFEVRRIYLRAWGGPRRYQAGRSDGVTGHFPLDCVALYAEDARERFFLTKVLIRTYSLRLARCRELAADYSA